MGGVEQANEDRVWRAWRGSELRLVQRAHEKWVVNPLDGADLAGDVGGCDAHPMFASDVLQLGREPVRARGVLDDALSAVQLCEERPRREINCDRLVLKRTFQQGDDRGPARAVLSVGSITYPRQVPSVLLILALL
ncbi:MAG TPA: hypothetical protein VGU71_11180 [Candidatus Dormibacteraeota bacterium]|nr:hypothetical protein [Candidatus Dormibacteraeota bacterium]